MAAAGNTTVVNTNTTYVSLAGRQLKAVDVSRLLTALDFLGCVVFLCFILFFKWRISRLSHSLQDHTISVGDYAVFVKGACPVITSYLRLGLNRQGKAVVARPLTCLPTVRDSQACHTTQRRKR